MANTPKNHCYVCTLTKEQIALLKEILCAASCELKAAPYCEFKTEYHEASIAAYSSGKLVVQGKGTGEFVDFLLEPQILKGDAFAGMIAETEFFPHAGIDESGKGDFFGPLVIACVFVEDRAAAEKLASLGVRDSKAIKSDAQIAQIAQQILPAVNGQAAVVAIGPEAYNRFYDNIRNLNRLLAWGHARTLENLLEKVPACTSALADKFGDERLIRNALMEQGRKIELRQQTKAESDIAVAAASILARAEFVRRMSLLGKEVGMELPKGAGPQVDKVARSLAEQGGRALLSTVAKMHFSTAAKALGQK